MEWTAPLPKSFNDLLSGWPKTNNRGIYSKIWNICPAIISWEIWKERNRRIFKDQEMLASSLVLKIEASITETLNSYIRKSQFKEGSFTLNDSIIKRNWNKLINPPYMYSIKNSEARKNCNWSPPPQGWYKLNFDGASRGNPGLSGIGCIIHNETGRWLMKLEKHIPPTSNNLAELEAVSEGIKVCLKLGLSKVIIKGDSQIVINALRKKSTPNWVLNSKLEEIIKLMEGLETFQLIHIYREGNTLANELANLGVDGSDFIKLN